MEQGETQAGELAPPPAMTTTICSTEDFLAGGKLPAEVGTDEELQSPPKQKQFNSAGMTGAASTATQQVPPPAPPHHQRCFPPRFMGQQLIYGWG